MTLSTRFNLWVIKTFDCFPVPLSKEEQDIRMHRAAGRSQAYWIMGTCFVVYFILREVWP